MHNTKNWGWVSFFAPYIIIVERFVIRKFQNYVLISIICQINQNSIIFGKCIKECLETRKLKQGLWCWNICSLSVYIFNILFKALNPTRNIVFIYILYIYIPVCIIASNDNNHCIQFVCPYCGPIDWNNKYSYSYSYPYQ